MREIGRQLLGSVESPHLGTGEITVYFQEVGKVENLRGKQKERRKGGINSGAHVLRIMGGISPGSNGL